MTDRDKSSSAGSAAALTERLIQAAVDYEQGRCSSRELAEARAAVEAAMPGAAQAAPKPGEPASRGAIAQTFLDEDYQDKQLDSFDMADIMLRHWDVRWKEAAQPPAAPVGFDSLSGARKQATESHASMLPPPSADTWDAECARIEADFYATVGRYCTFGPPAERKRQWIILFEDADRGVMVFDDEREAHTAWDRAKDNWTCTLYETAHRKFVFAAGQLRPIVQPQTVPTRDKWPEIDSELTAYIQTIRAQLIEECAQEALRCDTHALFCMADPRAVRSDIADRIRALALTRPHHSATAGES